MCRRRSNVGRTEIPAPRAEACYEMLSVQTATCISLGEKLETYVLQCHFLHTQTHTQILDKGMHVPKNTLAIGQRYFYIFSDA